MRPGFIYTEMHASGGEPNRVDRVKAFVPMKRGGSPEEIAEPILWLPSDAASFITGTFIDVAGGRQGCKNTSGVRASSLSSATVHPAAAGSASSNDDPVETVSPS